MSISEGPLRILVVGQTPPPLGGQAMMIQKLLDGRFQRIRLYHIRLAFSHEMDEIGRFKLRKVFHLFEVMAKIIWYRFRHRITVLYYPPAGPNMVPVMRDILLLNTVRWMFRYTVFHFHGGGVSTFAPQLPAVLRPLFHKAYARPDLSIRLTTMAPEDGLYFKAKDNVIVLNGIEDDAGGPIDRSTRTPGPVRLLFAAVLIPSKGVEVLLNSFLLLHKRGLDVELNLMGKWGSKEFEKQCMEFIQREGIADRVHILGVRSGEAKAQDFRNADIFCFPSYFEAEVNPLVLIESLQYSLPVVSTHWRGIPTIVTDRVNGLLVPVKDPAAVADAVEELVKDPALRLQLGKAGRKIFEERYTLDRHLHNMEEAFLRLGSK